MVQKLNLKQIIYAIIITIVALLTFQWMQRLFLIQIFAIIILLVILYIFLFCLFVFSNYVKKRRPDASQAAFLALKRFPIMILIVIFYGCLLGMVEGENPIGILFVEALILFYLYAHYLKYKKEVKNDDHSDIISEADWQHWLKK